MGNALKGDERDVFDRSELGEGQAGENGQAVQVESAADGLDGAAAKLGQVGNVVSDNVALDLLRSTDIDGARSVRADDDGSGDGGASSQRVSISSIGDSRGGLRAEGRLGVLRS